MRSERKKETSRRFQNEEGPITSYQQQKKLVMQRAPQYSTMSTLFEEESEWNGDGGNLEYETLRNIWQSANHSLEHSMRI